MKKTGALLIAALVLLSVLLTGCSGRGKTITLNVYNWGEYISDGSEGTFDVNAAFEDYYYETYGVQVQVNYTTYASNEDMYNKIRSGATRYDVIFPSDYMIERMIAEGLLRKLDFDRIPNFEYIDPEYRNLFYDPENEYTVPYAYGMYGIIYNSTLVEEDVTGWDSMWDERYSGQILQFNNPRDAFGTAMYKLGIDVNTTDRAEWDRAKEMLSIQKPLVQSYVMDEIFNKMKNGSAAIACYYAGDFLTMYEDNEDLCFVYPEEGTNVYVDAMCIPTCSAYPEVAEEYINFLLSEEPAVANAEYTYYATPNRLVRENEEYIECMTEIHEDAMSIIYPEAGTVNATFFENLDPDTLAYENALWESLKIESNVSVWVYIVSGAIVLGLVSLLIYRWLLNRYRDKYYYSAAQKK